MRRISVPVFATPSNLVTEAGGGFRHGVPGSLRLTAERP